MPAVEMRSTDCPLRTPASLSASSEAALQRDRQSADGEHEERNDAGHRQAGRREQQYERRDQAECEVKPGEPDATARLAPASAQLRDVCLGVSRGGF